MSKSVCIGTDRIAFLVRVNNEPKIFVMDFSSGYQVYSGVNLPNESSFDMNLFDTNKINIRFLDTSPNPWLNNLLPGEIISNKFFNSSLSLTFPTYIGFSQNSANTGETVTVNLCGGSNVDENQSGLEIFEEYYLLSNGDLTTGNPSGALPIGPAISENSIILRYNQSI
jgi:hypothetical protein